MHECELLFRDEGEAGLEGSPDQQRCYSYPKHNITSNSITQSSRAPKCQESACCGIGTPGGE